MSFDTHNIDNNRLIESWLHGGLSDRTMCEFLRIKYDGDPNE